MNILLLILLIYEYSVSVNLISRVSHISRRVKSFQLLKLKPFHNCIIVYLFLLIYLGLLSLYNFSSRVSHISRVKSFRLLKLKPLNFQWIDIVKIDIVKIDNSLPVIITQRAFDNF